MNNKILTIPFLQVPVEFVAWENNNSGRKNCAFVLAQLIHMHNLKDSLNILESNDGFMHLTTNMILECMYYSIKNANLRRCLRILEDEGLIEKLNTNTRTQSLKINNTNIDKLLETYKLHHNRKFFTVYYPCFAYQQDSQGRTNISYMISMFMQLYQAHQFKLIMTDEYISNSLGGIFSIAQVRYMLNKLQKDSLISIVTYTSHKGESYISRRKIYYNNDVVNEILVKYRRTTYEPISYQGGNIDEELMSIYEDKPVIYNEENTQMNLSYSSYLDNYNEDNF